MVLSRSSISHRQQGYTVETIDIHKTKFSIPESDDHTSILRETACLDLYLSDVMYAKDLHGAVQSNVSPSTYKLNFLCEDADLRDESQSLTLSHGPDLQGGLMTLAERSSQFVSPGHGETGDDEKENLLPSDERLDNTTDNNNDDNEEESGDLDFPNLTEQEVLAKLQDIDVIKQFKAINSLRDMNLANLKLLEQVERTDPAIKRILTRPRLTIKDVKDTNVDADIKATVNEFLQTNVTGNFIMARVLRENYNAFYTWLTAHLQVERNAWAARLRLAMEMIDKQRRHALQTNDQVERSAKRLHNLILSCNEARLGSLGKVVTDKSHQANCKSHTTTQACNCSFSESVQDGSQPARDHISGNEEISRACKQNYDKLIYILDMHNQGRGEDADLFASSNKQDESTFSRTRSKTNIEHDVCSPPDKCYKQNPSGEGSRHLTHSKSFHAVTKNSTRKKNEFRKANNAPEPYVELNSVSGRKSNWDKDEPYMERDDDTDWDRVMYNSLNSLTEICDKLIKDRLSCLQLVGVGHNECPSLVEAVSAYIQDKHCIGQPKPVNLDEKITLLESENARLCKEIHAIKSALTEKSKEAVSLQDQVARLEALLKEDTALCSIGSCPQTKYLVGINIQAKKRTNKHSNGIQKISESVISKNITANGFYLRDIKTQDNDVHTIMPQSIKLTPEDKVRVRGAKQMKPYRINSIFTDSEVNTESSRSKSITGTLEKTQKKLKLVAIQNSIRDISPEMEITASNEKHKMCDSPIRVTATTKDASCHGKSLTLKSIKTDHCKKWPCSSYSAHSPTNRNTASNSLTKKSSEDLFEHVNSVDIDGTRTYLDSNVPNLNAGRAVVSTSNQPILPVSSDSVTGDACIPSVSNGHQFGHRTNGNSRNIQQTDNAGDNKDDPITKSTVDKKHNVQKCELPLTSTQAKETKSVLPQVKLQGKTLVSK